MSIRAMQTASGAIALAMYDDEGREFTTIAAGRPAVCWRCRESAGHGRTAIYVDDLMDEPVDTCEPDDCEECGARRLDADEVKT